MTQVDTPQVVGLCGSLRDESRTRIVLEEILERANAAGASTALVDLRDYELPPLNARDDVARADDLRTAIEEADSVVLGTPNYHGSYSGALKNALDYCGRDEFGGTTVGLLEVAAGSFPGTALVHLREVCRTLDAWTLPTEVAIPDSHSLVTADGITDGDLADRTRRLGRDLVAYATVDAHPELVTGSNAELAGTRR